MTLAVAAVTAVFSVLHGVLLTPLPYREPDRVALLRADLQGDEQEPLLTSMEFAELRDRTDLFGAVAAIVEANGSLTTPGDMEPLTAAATTAGVAGGLAGAFVVTRYLDTLLFRIDARDSLTFAVAAMLLGVVALGAAAIPAIRAARVDPMLAMRAE